MQSRLQVVGDIERPQHFHLDATHRCYFWGEYTPWEHTDGKRWNFSPTNRLIANLKKSVDRRGQSDWVHKESAIEEIGQAFAKFWKWSALKQAGVILVPMPPSRARTDPLYDDRMLRVVNSIKHHSALDLSVEELLVCNGSAPASHTAPIRPSIGKIQSGMSIDSIPAGVRPSNVFIFDDILTTGAHFVVACQLLQKVYPEARIIGNFVARSCRGANQR